MDPYASVYEAPLLSTPAENNVWPPHGIPFATGTQNTVDDHERCAAVRANERGVQPTECVSNGMFIILNGIVILGTVPIHHALCEWRSAVADYTHRRANTTIVETAAIANNAGETSIAVPHRMQCAEMCGRRPHCVAFSYRYTVVGP